MSGFAQVLAAAKAIPGGSAVTVPETWHQGRTAYGGFSSALALWQAMQVGGDGLPPLRSAQFAMIAPVAGDVTVTARIVREGRNAIWMAAEISGDKGVGLTASFVFMKPVASSLMVHDRPLPGGIIPVSEAHPFVNARGPAFIQNHFEVRFAKPRGEQRRAELCWWVRPREHEDLDPTVALLLTADGLPPGVMPLMTAAVPVSTMHWQVNLLTPAPSTLDGWWLLRSAGDFAQDGCASQPMSVWNSAGDAVMAGMQSIAVFG